jgi:DNA-binding transcriptional LysR family regulator
MNLQLDDVALFLRVVELGTLSAAARERNVPVSQVTRALARLEATCGVRLLNRSTHGLSLTDEGDTFVAHSRTLLDTTAALHAELTGKLGSPSGWVRVSTSPLLAQMIVVPSLPTLYENNPQLHIDLNADDRMTDMAREGIDIAIRTGTTHSDTVVARQIGDYTRRLYAAPAYLARFGTPQHPDDLSQHRLLANSVNPVLNRWTFHSAADGKPTELQVSGHTRTDNSAILMSLVQQGVGVARLMDLLAEPLVRRGELVPLLRADLGSPRVPIYAVMPRQRQRLPKIRACIDHWAAWLDEMRPAAN